MNKMNNILRNGISTYAPSFMAVFILMPKMLLSNIMDMIDKMVIRKSGAAIKTVV